MKIDLRPVQVSDVDVFFEQQLSPAANAIAMFGSADPTDRANFDARWERTFANGPDASRTILADGEVAGYLVKFQIDGQTEVGYWLGETFWGKGIATEAFRQFIQSIDERPLHATSVESNIASIRVLERNGFRQVGAGPLFASGVGRAVDAVFFELA